MDVSSSPNNTNNTSHLSHDSQYECSKLDVKVQLLAKERNKRESRALEYKSRILRRASEVSSRQHDHQLRLLRQGIPDLHAKTPSIDTLIPQRGMLLPRKGTPSRIKSRHLHGIDYLRRRSEVLPPIIELGKARRHTLPDGFTTSERVNFQTKNNIRKTESITNSLDRLYHRRSCCGEEAMPVSSKGVLRSTSLGSSASRT